ncbi:hypothetical protein SAMN02910456_01206 [Ruminococcaceae bacterium YRB3002]|nr:hypothetical protein SAMN02910456_01206 [Ruminococcaceae bacterium YRB3002]
MYEKIRESFLDELSDYYTTGQMPAHASVNMRRALTEHSYRLRKKDVSYRPRFISTIDERPGEVRFDTKSFITCNCYKHCNSVFEYSDGVTGLKCDETTDDVVYLQVIDRKDADKGTRSEDQIIICPNCGHRAPAAGFVDGCPMCSTKFEIDNVFPCVYSYYSMIWPMPKKDFVNRGIKIAMQAGLGAAGTILVLSFLGLLFAYDSRVIFALFGAVVLALMAGWITFCIVYAGVAIYTSVHATAGLVTMAANTMDMTGAMASQTRTEAAVRPLDPGFSFKLFEGKVLSYLKTLAYSDNRQNCSIYMGTGDLSFMDDLVDIRYRGATKLEKAVTVGDYMHLVVTVFLDNVYYRDGKFSVVRENFIVELARRKNVQTVPDFSAYNINCTSCGGSFDAVLSRKCPYCGSAYDLSSEDWSVLVIAKKQ